MVLHLDEAEENVAGSLPAPSADKSADPVGQHDTKDQDNSLDQGFDLDDDFPSRTNSSFTLNSSPTRSLSPYKYSSRKSCDSNFDRNSVNTTFSEPLDYLTESRMPTSPTLSDQADCNQEDESEDRDSAYSTFIPGNSSFNFSWPTITANNNGKKDATYPAFDFSNNQFYNNPRYLRSVSVASRVSSRSSLRYPVNNFHCEPIYEDPEDELKPPDGGYGWFVALGSFLVQFWSAGLIKTYGLIFMEVINTFPNSSNSTTSWIPSLLLFTSCVLAPFVSTLCSRFSCRTVVIAGGLICSIAMILSYMATSLGHMFLTIGVLLGVGSGMSQNPGVIMISQYFSKRKALANSICLSGNAVGGLLLPVLIEVLISEYGFRGTMLILGALLLHICVGGFLYLPIETYHKHRGKLKPSKVEPSCKSTVPLVEVPSSASLNTMDKRIKSSRHPSTRLLPVVDSGLTAISEEMVVNFHNEEPDSPIHPDTNESCPKSRFIVEKVDLDRVSTHSNSSLNLDRMSQMSVDRRPASFRGSSEIYFPIGVSVCSINHPARETRSSRASLTSGIMRSTLDLQMDANAGYEAASGDRDEYVDSKVRPRKSAFNLDLLKEKTFLVLGFSVIFMSIGTPLTQIYVPSYALTLKTTKAQASLIVSISSGIDLLARLFTGWFSDKAFIPTYKFYAFCTTVAGFTAIGIALSENYVSLVCFSCVFAAGIGSYIVLLPTALIENHGSESIGSSWALIRVFQGIVGLLAPPSIGTMIDTFGSFQYGFYLMGSAMLIGSFIILFIPLTYKKKTSNEPL